MFTCHPPSISWIHKHAEAQSSVAPVRRGRRRGESSLLGLPMGAWGFQAQWAPWAMTHLSQTVEGWELLIKPASWVG